MRNIIWFLALFFLLFIQGGILVPLRIAPVNMILVIVAIAVILSDFKQGLVITIIGGLLLDFVSGSPDGLISISLLSAFLILHVVMHEILSREPNRFILVSAVATGTVLYFLAFIVVDRLFSLFHLAQNPDMRYLLTVLLPLALMWNLIFAYPLLRYYSWVQNLASKIRAGEETIQV